MKRSVHFTLLMLLLGLAGCSRNISDANLNQVRPDMNSKEVESILGPPTRTESTVPKTEEVTKTVAVTHYYYEQNGHTVKLTFVGDRLASGGVNGNFGK